MVQCFALVVLVCRLLTKEEQVEYGCCIGVNYPEPIPASSFKRPHKSGRVGGDPAGATKPSVHNKHQSKIWPA